MKGVPGAVVPLTTTVPVLDLPLMAVIPMAGESSEEILDSRDMILGFDMFFKRVGLS